MAFLAIENTASSSSIPPPPPPSSSSDEWIYTYDVFLSFRGTDTRNKFTDHLYNRLEQKGICTFRDDERLERGTLIAPELSRAIKESRIAVVILSSDYASSRWCLAELAMIVECMEMKKLRVLPVFHYVDPSDVRNQWSTFGKAFEKHNERCKDNTEDLQRWRAALTNVANLAGWTLHSNEPESKVIEDIVKKIEGELKSTYSFDYKDLVGINCRSKKLENLLDMVSDEVRFIGIWGAGGMGKTTLAQVVYDRFRSEFQGGSSFLKNVREESGKPDIVHLQEKLLSDILIDQKFDFSDFRRGSYMIKKKLCRKKVLVILDDVDKLDQLEALAGEQSWFGGGSRIIITTRNQHILISYKVPEAQIYKAEEMNTDEALELFSRKAFEEDHPPEGYEEKSKKFIDYAAGLPLALEVLGSSLRRISLDLWESKLAQCKDNPPRNILDVLQISFNGLEEREKNIFLDIACFYRGGQRDYVTNILQTLYDKPDFDIYVLLKKSLIIISKGCFQMHDLLQELGRDIVRRENPKEAGDRSRLWDHEDIFHVLKENTGTKSVEGIFLGPPLEIEEYLNAKAFPTTINLDAKAFSEMINLGVLKINNVNFPNGLNYLSNKLRFIFWKGYPLKSLPTSFELYELVELHMRYSLIEKLWEGIKSLNKLKLIDLSNSKNLIETLDFSGVPNLEKLILQRCTRLSKIHESLGNLKQLTRLDLSGCTALTSLLRKINLKSLEVLILSGCSMLKKFPDVVENMSYLWKLYLDGTAIEELPISMQNLSGLIELNLSRSSIRVWPLLPKNLEVLILSGCSRLKKFPDIAENMSYLSNLYLDGTAIEELPISIQNLSGLIELNLSRSSIRVWHLLPKNLEVLILSGCSRLKKFPEIVEKMSHLSELYLDRTPIEELPLSVKHLSGLTKLDISRSAIKVWPLLPKSLEVLNLEGCEGLLHTSSPDRMHMLNRSLSGLYSLTELNLRDCGLLAIPNVLGCLSSLKHLNLMENNFVGLPKSIVLLSNLEELSLSRCKELRSVPELPLQIKSIGASYCPSLETLALRPGENFHPSIYLDNCVKLMDNQGDHCDMLMTILRQYAQASVDSKHPDDLNYGLCSHLLIPRREIPKWFSHQCEGDSLKLNVPSDLLINNICKGVAICSVIEPNNDSGAFCCKFIVNGYVAAGYSWPLRGYHSKDPLFKKIESNTLSLVYFFPSKFKYIWEKTNKPSEFLIEISYRDSNPVVKSCGAHLVYDENIEYVNQTKARYSSCIITPYEDDLDNSTKGTRIKRSRGDHDANEAGLREEGNSNDVDLPHPKRIRCDDSDGEGAGPSGEATSNDIDIPHPKSVQLPNLIQRLMLYLGNWIGSLCAQRQGDSDCEEEEFQ